MEERKQHQPSMTIEEQVENLKSIGCKCQYKNVGFLENKSVGFPTSLFSIF